jgi:uncharacterized protein with beta-barrel porin domain
LQGAHGIFVGDGVGDLSSGHAGALRRRVLLSGTMLAAAAVGYGRRAYGGSVGGACLNSGGSTYLCSGAATVNVTAQAITANNASVSTVAGFGVNTPTGNAITITGNGALSYTDSNASPLTTTAAGFSTALSVTSGNNYLATPGSVTINTNGALRGYSGIGAYNSGTGAITVTANGNVTATNGVNGIGISSVNSSAGTNLSVTTGASTTVSGGSNGISAINYGTTGALTIKAYGNVTGHTAINATNLGTNLTVTTAAGTTVSGGAFGITANNQNGSTGAVTITANGDVTGTANSGISAINNGTDLSVTTAALTTVRGGNRGIYARNYGTGATTITANGNATSTIGDGIYARNFTGTDLSVTTAAGTTVSGGNTGIDARNSGTGAVTITANGDVTGTTGSGIYAKTGTSLSVTTAAGTTVSGGGSNGGIFAGNSGTGAVTVTANGNVTGTSARGISFSNFGTDVTVTTGAGTTVSGATGGIGGRNLGTGALTITANGDVTGAGAGSSGINVLNYGTNLSVAIGAGAKVSGSADGINVRNLGSGALTVTANGNVTGTSGSGISVVSGGSPIAITVAATGTVTSANAFAIQTVGAAATVTVAGTVAGSMQIAGPGSTLTFQPGAVYKVFVNPATASLANVGGTATLGGATVNAAWANGSYIARQYTIVTAGSVSGTFNPTVANTNLPANFHDTLSYDATHAYLNLILSFTTPSPGGLNGNQQAVANALTNFFNSTGGIPAAFSSLNAGGLTQVSGETATGSQATTFNAMNQFMGLLTDPFIDGRGDGVSAGGTAATGYASTQKPAAIRDAYAMFTKAPLAQSYDPRWSVWAAGFGGSQTTDGNATQGSNSATSRVFGMAAGADYRFSPYTIAGFALAGGGTNFSVAGAGSGRSDLFQAGAFVRHTVGPAYISGALAYGWQDVTTDRTVTVAGIDQLRARFNANAWSGRVEGGYRFVTPWVGGIGITPYAAGQFTTFDLPAYAEQAIVGSNQFALAFGSKSVTDTRSELGLRTDKSFAMQTGVLTLRGRFAWAHDFNPDRAIGATFQALPGASFVVNGARQASDSALTTASAEMKWMNGWSTAATFEGEFSNVTRSYAGKGVVRYQW